MGLCATPVLMPKAALDLNDLLQPWENHIGSAWKGLDVQPVTKTHAMHKTPYRHLRRRIFAPDTPHVLAAPFR